MAKQKLFAGTSGFDKPWKGTFYPEDIKKAELLAYYSARLPVVEINNTFYRLPKPEVMDGWFEQTPDSFRFAIKASRRITHIKRLNDVEEPTAYLMASTEHLKHKLGPLLFQLPPNAKKNTERLKAFLATLPPDRRVTFEFRHPTWFEADAIDALRDHGAALCIADDDKDLAPFEATVDWGYMRFRKDDYTDESLETWVERIASQAWSETFIFFEGAEGGRGPKWARQMMDLAAKAGGK
ncbi:MAG: DUF72 domain-containing protein [Proteobacteria bacterium]|nr:DUF72 domain-containing protein [Pseudomonadota bacterium]MDA1057503.1 DUF72 domain-containing protein [Pseudomonadota bacterium]